MILQLHSFRWGSSTWPRINHQRSDFHKTISNSISVTPNGIIQPNRMGTIPVTGPCAASLCVQTVQCHHYFGSTSAVSGPSGSIWRCVTDGPLPAGLRVIMDPLMILHMACTILMVVDGRPILQNSQCMGPGPAILWFWWVWNVLYRRKWKQH